MNNLTRNQLSKLSKEDRITLAGMMINYWATGDLPSIEELEEEDAISPDLRRLVEDWGSFVEGTSKNLEHVIANHLEEM